MVGGSIGWAGEGLGHLHGAQGVGHGRLAETRDGDDVARLRALVDRLALQAAEGQHLGDAPALDLLAVAAERVDRHAGHGLAAVDAAGQQAAKEGVALDQHAQHAEGLVGALDRLGLGHVAHDQVEQGAESVVRLGHVHCRPAVLAAGVDVREVQLLVGGAHGGEEVEGVVQDAVGVGVRAVHLVQAQDRSQAHLQRLAQHELGLGHDPFLGVDEQHTAIHHAEDPLDLAAEVGVAGGVDDVDPRIASLAVPQHAGALGQDGDAPLTLLIVGVHRALDRRLVGAEHARLRQKLVDQRGLAVVDVGDDGDVAKRHGRVSLNSPTPIRREARAAREGAFR